MPTETHDNETERRSGIDRRQFTYALHIPERRIRKERRRRWRKRSRRLPEAMALEALETPPTNAG